MEDTPDRFSGGLVHASRLEAVSATLEVFVNVRTVTASRERRQGCQRLGTHASRREDNAHRDDRPTQRGHVRPAEASLL